MFSSLSGEGKIKYLTIACGLLLAVVVALVLVIVFTKSEHMKSFYLDQIAMQSTDPAYVKFVGREGDPLGMSMRDYYLEHTLNAKNLIEADYNDDQMYYNTTDYLQMPRMYRPAPGEIFPKTLSRYVNQGDNVTAQDGELSSDKPIIVGSKSGINKKTDSVDSRFLK